MNGMNVVVVLLRHWSDGSMKCWFHVFLGPTCVLVADAPCDDVSLKEAVHLDAAAEHQAMFWLPRNEKGQAAVVTVAISGSDKLSGDDGFLSLTTAQNWVQTSNQSGDLIIHRVYLHIKTNCLHLISLFF